MESVPFCHACSGTLRKYNLDVKKFIGSYTIPTNESLDVSIPMLIPASITTPGVRGFELHYVVRNNSNNWSRSGIINFLTDGTGKTINYNGDATPGITISNISLVDTDGVITINFTVSHTQEMSIRFGGFLEYIGTDRSY